MELTFDIVNAQTSQLSQFGRVTHDFTTYLTTAYQSHDLV